MTTMTASRARANLFSLLAETSTTHQPVHITGRRHSGILISEEDFRAIQETLYLLSIPGMREGLLRAKTAPLRVYSKKRPW